MKRAVIVDDEPTIREILSGFLKDIGWDVVATGSTGYEAVKLCAKHEPDLLLLDINLPDASGIDTAKTINSSVPTAIIISTAYDDDKYIEEALKSECVMAYLVKPIDIKDLKPVTEFAVARFNEHKKLVLENCELKDSVESRKVIEKAKGLLMKKDGVSESEAYGKLRKISMDKRKSMKEICEIFLLASA